MSNRVGIILAGGMGTRLSPLTIATTKHLLPIFDKPMIYYPLSTLMLAGIKDILVISDKRSLDQYQLLLGDGSNLGISLNYKIQNEPKGIAEAFIIAKSFIGSRNSTLILGDNIFYGNDLSNYLKYDYQSGATIFAYHVSDPSRYGVVDFDNNFNVKSIEEKPDLPKSNYAITGLYFYDSKVVDLAESLKPSERGELEITDLNELYLDQGKLFTRILNRGFAWLDTGTFESLREASNFVANIQNRQSLMIACLEEIAFKNNWIDHEELLRSYQKYKNTTYGDYLLKLSKENQ